MEYDTVMEVSEEVDNLEIPTALESLQLMAERPKSVNDQRFLHVVWETIVEHRQDRELINHALDIVATFRPHLYGNAIFELIRRQPTKVLLKSLRGLRHRGKRITETLDLLKQARPEVWRAMQKD